MSVEQKPNPLRAALVGLLATLKQCGEGLPERALAAEPPEVTIGPMLIDNGWIHGEVLIAGERVGQVDSHGEYDLLAKVAEALGAKVVRRG